MVQVVCGAKEFNGNNVGGPTAVGRGAMDWVLMGSLFSEKCGGFLG